MFTETLAWLILLLPVAAFVLNGVVVRGLLGPRARLAGWVAIAAIGAAFALSVWALASVINGNFEDMPVREWLSAGTVRLTFGILLDPLTAIMLVVVSGVSLLVQVYSQAYMTVHAPGHNGQGDHAHPSDSPHAGVQQGDTHPARSTAINNLDSGYTRYYAYMSLFTASMLGLVLSRNIVQVFVFWELVGVSSYLLIGFWMDRPAAAAAAKKAFIMTRFADFGFLLGILYLFHLNPEWLDLPSMYHAAETGLLAGSAATWVALGLFTGAAGKSAQVPFHSWLPDAMEGPTPVSALIHSATMVTAGVFLVARTFPLFEASGTALNVVAVIGAVTAVFAATMGLVANDIKRVLAYSTISQLGYMMMALGIGAYVPAVFHLFTHAWFKAMLFLGSGSVHHGVGTFNMRYMGGLRKDMPWTYIAMVIGSLSLAGIVGFSGFWSKDEILAHAAEAGGIGTLVLVLGLVAVVMTAFYMFRAIFMTFHGEFRGGGEKEKEDLEHAGEPVPPGLEHATRQESPLIMLGPILLLAVLAIGIGFIANPPFFDIGPLPRHWLAEFLTHNAAVFPTPEAAEHAGGAPHFNPLIALVSTALAVLGIMLAAALYLRGRPSPERAGRMFGPLYNLASRKFYVDELYEGILVRRLFYGGVAQVLDRLDKALFDGSNNQGAIWTARLGRGLTFLQNGQAQMYGLAMAVGIAVIITVFVVWGR